MEKSAKIFVAGHRGLFGKGLVRALGKAGYTNIVTRSRAELDLTNQSAVMQFFQAEKPEYVFLAAAKVGGIFANMADPLSFVRDNLMIQNNVFDAAHKSGVKKFLFLGSSCIYPRDCEQPMKEEYYLDGKPEPTNQSYAISKMAGLQMCMAHNAALKATGKGMECRAVQPPNLYGEGDHFGPQGHALAGMMHRMHQAKLRGDKAFTVWGTGRACREWMHVDDAADAALYAMTMDWADQPFYNIGTGAEYSMAALANEIRTVLGYQGTLLFDTSKPDGMPRKLLDSSKFLAKGWQPSVGFADGLKRTYAYYLTLPESQPEQGKQAA